MHTYLLLVVMLSGGHATLHQTKYHIKHDCNSQVQKVAKDKHVVYAQCFKV